MNVAAHQEEKNEETKTGKRKSVEEGRQATDFKEAVCCLSAVVQGAAQRKMVCTRGVPGVTGTLEKTNCNFDPTQTRLGPHHHVEAAVDWCRYS